MPRPQTFRVVGNHPVDGHQPGATFQAAYSKQHRQYLITAGHVELVRRAEGQPGTPDRKEQ